MATPGPSALYGHIDKFDLQGKETFPNYLERLEFYFMANDIESDNKKKAIFLSSVGPDTFRLIRDLCTPSRPNDKTFPEICDLLKQHVSPDPNIIVERCAFYGRSRKESESVAEFVAQLRHLSRHCAFSDNLNDQIRDRIVCGVNNSDIQRKLLAVGNTLTLDTTLKLAISIETASKNAQSIGQNNFGQHAVDSKDKNCHRCGNNHDPNSCPFKNKDCFYCKNIGHTAKMCRKKKYMQKNGEKTKDEKEKPSSIKQMEVEGEKMAAGEGVGGGLTGESYEMYNIYRCEVRREKPLYVNPKIDDVDSKMEVDTGAALTCMGNHDFRKKFEGVKLYDPGNIRLKSWTGELVKPVGIADVDVVLEGQSKRFPLLVTPGKTPSLLGRN